MHGFTTYCKCQDNPGPKWDEQKTEPIIQASQKYWQRLFLSVNCCSWFRYTVEYKMANNLNAMSFSIAPKVPSVVQFLISLSTAFSYSSSRTTHMLSGSLEKQEFSARTWRSLHHSTHLAISSAGWNPTCGWDFHASFRAGDVVNFSTFISDIIQEHLSVQILMGSRWSDIQWQLKGLQDPEWFSEQWGQSQ